MDMLSFSTQERSVGRWGDQKDQMNRGELQLALRALQARKVREEARLVSHHEINKKKESHTCMSRVGALLSILMPLFLDSIVLCINLPYSRRERRKLPH